MLVKPVTLPPGSGKLATKPLPTGSETLTNTIGIVRVCCSSAAVVGVISESRRSGCSSTSSFADRRIDRKSAGIGQRILIRMLRPSAQLSSWRASRSAARLACVSASVSAYPISRPICRIRSARAADCHARFKPPTKAMNSRRLTRPTPICTDATRVSEVTHSAEAMLHRN